MARTNRELCMLAQVYDQSKHRSAGMYLSEKLDGQRALWLPVTKGKMVKDIPFANREKDEREHIATGLWSRYGKIIHCPMEYTDGWPDRPLDGELWLGPKQFQDLMKITRRLTPDDSEWMKVGFHVFDAPSYGLIFQTGKINTPNYEKFINREKNFEALGITNDTPTYNFDSTYKLLKRDGICQGNVYLHEQELLPFLTTRAIEIINERLNAVTSVGGEGLMLRHPASHWEPIRSQFLLKVKKLHDAEATVTGFRAGLGKYLGMLGSLQVMWGSVVFDLSGFTDEERRLKDDFVVWARANPGELFPRADYPSAHFKVGDSVTFRYRECTDSGIPKEARYLRKYEHST